MSVWIERSFERYSEQNVMLDLSEIYPSELNEPREILPADRASILAAYNQPRNGANNIELFTQLLSAKYQDEKGCIFPIQHSYVAMFRRYPAAERNGAIVNNPGMINQIIDQVYETHPSADEMFEAIEMPPTSSRQLGQAFNRWCEETFPIIHNDIDTWNQCTEPISLFCSGEDRRGIDWARDNLNITISTWVDEATGLDLVCKINRPDTTVAYIFGEAKFLSDQGGSQKKQRDAAWGLAIDRNLGGNRVVDWNPDGYDVRMVAILDGVCWIENNNNAFTTPLKDLLERGLEDNLAMSALILPEYFQSVLDEVLDE